MKRFFSVLTLGLLLLSWSGWSVAGINAYSFDDPVKEERFNNLADELRCLVCQNQSIAESNADLAKDLRQEIYEMIQQGRTDAEIIDFMVQRYGDFVLYRPPVKPATVPLWIGPMVLFAIGVGVLIVLVRRWGGTAESTELSDDERQRLRNLLNEKEDGSR